MKNPGVAASMNFERDLSLPLQTQSKKSLQFSLFYFDGKGASVRRDKYRLLIEGAKYADTHGFLAVWTPERHFHPFGGIYANPAITSAALATVTSNVRLRAGSVVAPLHQFIRIAEEWAMVDNLSGGRVDISFASGWHADDFALHPSRYSTRKETMIQAIQDVRKLWRGEQVSAENGVGHQMDLKIFPRPLQPELPIWVTCSGAPDTFELAGQLGAGVLTHLLGQSIEELEAKIKLYRAALAQHGHQRPGHVTLMLHTFLGESREKVRETVGEPLCEYLSSSLNLIEQQLKQAASGTPGNLVPWRKSISSTGERHFAARQSHPTETSGSQRELLTEAFNRYFEKAGLFGTPETCLPMLSSVRGAGVDEVACLVDFGVDVDSVLRSLEFVDVLKSLHERWEEQSALAQIAGFNEHF
ncbi:MAG: LLM class flavin-dependent oxidoreductase [Candidatus Angelobacter sp.]